MKISAVPSPGATAGGVSGGIDPQAQRVQSVRALKMNTNATPGADLVQEPAISDNNDPANATTEETEPLSPQLAALARQRRALQVKERELADREKALTNQQPTQGNAELLARLKSQPLSVLLEAGVTYDQLTEAILANPSGDSQAAVESRIKALEESFDKKLADRDTQAEQAALAEMGREASRLAAEGDAFEMIRLTRSVPKVVALIERVYRKDGEILDVQEAMQLVEDDLIEQGLKLAGVGKVQSRVAPPLASQAPKPGGMRTLTNRDTAQVPQSRKQRAIAAFHNQLKK